MRWNANALQRNINVYASINENLESQLESSEMFEVLICCLAI